MFAVGAVGRGPAARPPVSGKRPVARKRKPRKRKDTFHTYIHRVMKMVHPGLCISKMAMDTLNDFVTDMLHRIGDTATHLTTDVSKRKTLSTREVQSAVRLELPGELAKHAVSEGTKAVTGYNSSFDEPWEKGVRGRPIGPKLVAAGSQSKRAGLQFPVGRVKRLMAERSRLRIGRGAPVYMAAVLEYLVAEVMELGGNASRDLKTKRMTPRHTVLAIRGDEELDALVGSRTVIPFGGVIPRIHKSLITKKKQPSSKPSHSAAAGGGPAHGSSSSFASSPTAQF